MTPSVLDLKVVALGRVYRRVALGKLVDWAMEGRIATANMVCPAGSDDWHSVLDVPELAASLPQGVARADAAADEEAAELDIDRASQWVAQRPRRRRRRPRWI